MPNDLEQHRTSIEVSIAFIYRIAGEASIARMRMIDVRTEDRVPDHIKGIIFCHGQQPHSVGLEYADQPGWKG